MGRPSRERPVATKHVNVLTRRRDRQLPSFLEKISMQSCSGRLPAADGQNPALL